MTPQAAREANRRNEVEAKLRAVEKERDALLANQEAREHRLRSALQGFLDAWLNCDRTLTEADWEEMDDAELEARSALQRINRAAQKRGKG